MCVCVCIHTGKVKNTGIIIIKNKKKHIIFAVCEVQSSPEIWWYTSQFSADSQTPPFHFQSACTTLKNQFQCTRHPNVNTHRTRNSHRQRRETARWRRWEQRREIYHMWICLSLLYPPASTPRNTKWKQSLKWKELRHNKHISIHYNQAGKDRRNHYP